MIADLKPYADYKESGLAWLGRVPAHWDISRSKRLFSAGQELARPDDVQLSATQAFGVIAQSDYEQRTGYRVVKISMHLDKRRHVEAGDFVISMRSFQGGLERAWATGAIRSSYVVLKPSAQVDANYFRYLFKSAPYIAALRITADFIRDGQDLNYSNFCGVDLPLIPLAEQAAISRFLGWANERLERTIRAKRKVIFLLREQKQAVIRQAVTQGLDPKATFKYSGISWLGDIPDHWQIKRFKFLATINSGQVDPREKQYRDMVLIAPNHIETGSGRLCAQQSAFEQGADSGKYLVRQGQIIYSKIRPNLRKATIAPLDCLCSADMYPMTPKIDELLPEYLLMLLLSPPFTKFAVDASMRVAMPKVNREALADCPLWYPSLVEQADILRIIAAETQPIEKPFKRFTREIDLLREYRTRLIADVVTGKLDVREAALHLPDDIAADADATAEDLDSDDETDDSELTEVATEDSTEA